MGTARIGRDKRDFSRHETVYVDPDYERLRAAAGLDDHDARITRGVIAGGSSIETLGGLVALVVTLAGFSALPFQMAGVAVIALGFALFAQGIAITSRWRDAARRLAKSRGPRPELIGSGVSVEMFAGLVGIVLGILALSGVQPLSLLPSAAIVFGGALLLGGAVQPDLVYLAPERNPKVARMTYGAIQTSGGVMVLVGVASVVLGILALLEVGPTLALTLIALLSLGVALSFAGGALTTRLVRHLTRPR